LRRPRGAGGRNGNGRGGGRRDRRPVAGSSGGGAIIVYLDLNGAMVGSGAREEFEGMIQQGVAKVATPAMRRQITQFKRSGNRT
jgi:hypothetical protein